MSGSSEEQIAEPRVFLPHGQLIVMGEEKAGKTSLVRALTEGIKGKTTRQPLRGSSIPTVDVHLVNEHWQRLDFKELVLGDFSRDCWRIFLAQLLYWPLFMELVCCVDVRKYRRIEDFLEIDFFSVFHWFNFPNLDNHKVGMLVQFLLITALHQILFWKIFGGWCVIIPMFCILEAELLRIDPVLFRKKRLEMCSFVLIGLIVGSLIQVIVHYWFCDRGCIDSDQYSLISMAMLACVMLCNLNRLPLLLQLLLSIANIVILFPNNLGVRLQEFCYLTFTLVVVVVPLFCFCQAASENLSVGFSRNLFPKTDFVLDMLDVKAELFALLYTVIFTLIVMCGLTFYSEDCCLNFVLVTVIALLCFHFKYIFELTSDLQEVHKKVFVAEAFCALLLFIGYFVFGFSFVYVYFSILLLVLINFSAHIYGRWLQVKGSFADMPITKYFRVSWNFTKLTFQGMQFRFCIIFHVLISISNLVLDNIWYGPETSLLLRLIVYILIVCILPLKILYQFWYFPGVAIGILPPVCTIYEFVAALFWVWDVTNDSQKYLERRYIHIMQWKDGQVMYNYYGIHMIGTGIIDVAVSVMTLWHQFGPVLMDEATDGILDSDIQIFSEVRRQEIIKREYTKEIFEAFATVKLQITDLTGDPEHCHQVGLSNDPLCMYMIVFNLKNMVEDNFRNAEFLISRIAFLLQSIYARISNESPTFLVATHCAGISPSSMTIVNKKFEDSASWLIFCDWIQKGKFAYHPVDTDDKLLKGIDSLQRIIMTELIENASKITDYTVPLSKVIIQDNILQLRNAFGLGSTCMKLSELKKRVETSLGNITPDVLEYLRDKGVLIYADCTSGDKKWVSLQPQTVFSIFRCMSNIPGSILQRRGCEYGTKLLQEHGILTKGLLSCILSRFQENYEGMTTILENCELIFPLKLNAQQAAENLHVHVQEQTCWGQEDGSKEETHFVPALLPQPEHPQIWKQRPDDLKFYVDSHRFLPKQLFYRFMSLAHTRSLKYSADNRPKLYQDEGRFWLSPQQPYMAKFLQHEGLIEITFCSTANVSKKEGGLAPFDVLSIIGSMIENITEKDFRHLKFYCGPACPADNCEGSRHSRYSQRRHVFNVYPRCKTPLIDQVSMFCGNQNYKEQFKNWLPY